MDEQLKALLEGINALKNGQGETRQEMQKGLDDTKNELKDRMEKGQEETKQEMQKLVEEKVQEVGEEIERIKEQVEEKIKEQVEKRTEVAEGFSLISQRVEDLQKLLVCANKNESKILPSSPVHVSTSPVPVTASTVSVKLSTYDGKTNWEVYKTQFSIISEANRWTEGVKACQLAASLRGEAAEILQTLPDTERLNLNSLYNALDLRFSQKYSKDYTRLQMKTRLRKTGESLQEYTSEVERLANLAFSDHPATVREAISLEYFVDGLKDEEIQKAKRMADVKDLKSALLYALKVEAATQASCIDRHSIRESRVTADEPCESRCIKEIEKLIEEMHALIAQRQNRRRCIMCWGCGESEHLRSNCPRNNKEDRRTSGAGHLRNNCPRVNQKDSHHANVIKSKKVCSHQKGSANGNIEASSRRPCTENSKYSWGVKKKFGVIDPVVSQVTMPSTSESEPWSDESVRKDQRADPEIK
ncbi:uncharacterized protein TNCV_2446631 [Trichonephila clavipes]|nr:uncharacterized protein TNCV_2446631 [Trichonephila clavipes]